MITLTVILLICLLIIQDVTFGLGMYKYSRSVDTNQFAPQTPCPTVFQYQNDENGNLVGAIKVDKADPEGRVQLDVELSLGNSVQGYNGKITLAEERQKVINDIMNRKPIYYRVHFPTWQNFPPRVTKILVNGDQICSGPRIPIQMVPVLTTINLQHKLSLGVTPLISSSDPTVDSSTFNNNLAPVFSVQSYYGRDADSNPTSYNMDLSNNIFLKGLLPHMNANPHEVTSIDLSKNVFFNGQLYGHGVGDNNFFGTRTTQSPVAPQNTRPPSRNGISDYNDICGRPLATNSLIVDGQTVPRGAYPWLVAIFKQLDNLSLSYICSGSLISDRHVVTAAHCVKTEYRRVKPSEIVCVFGKLNIRKWVTASEERMLEPESIIVHPDYETGKANADIAVMTFPDPIPFNKVIRPICLWQGSNDLNQVVGNLGTVVGWGRDENGAISTAEPRQIMMPIVDQLECLKGSSSSVGQALVEIVSKNTFCAGFRNGSGPCNGDSGSAFLLRKNGVFYLRGIVSTALSEVTHRSCNLKEYVVFADASKYLDWLLNILKQN